MMTEIEKRGLKIIATFHYARTYKYYTGIRERLIEAEVQGVDILDPKNEDYYWFLGPKERFIKNRKALSYESKTGWFA